MLNKKIKKLFIGTNNKGKLKEIRSLLPKNIEIFSTLDFKLKSPKENGKTFKENSLIKSKYFSKKTNLICLADDSGLEIDSLNRSPGIYSARWGGKRGNFNLAIKRVYRELKKKNKNWHKTKQTARFVCALTIYWPNNKFVNVTGKIEGTISRFKKGKNGFGYDPIFIPNKNLKTFGQMVKRKKLKIDHRYLAFKKLKKKIKIL